MADTITIRGPGATRLPRGVLEAIARCCCPQGGSGSGHGPFALGCCSEWPGFTHPDNTVGVLVELSVVINGCAYLLGCDMIYAFTDEGAAGATPPRDPGQSANYTDDQVCAELSLLPPEDKVAGCEDAIYQFVIGGSCETNPLVIDGLPNPAWDRRDDEIEVVASLACYGATTSDTCLAPRWQFCAAVTFREGHDYLADGFDGAFDGPPWLPSYRERNNTAPEGANADPGWSATWNIDQDQFDVIDCDTILISASGLPPTSYVERDGEDHYNATPGAGPTPVTVPVPLTKKCPGINISFTATWRLV